MWQHIHCKMSVIYIYINIDSFPFQEPADLRKQFPELAEDFHIPQFFEPEQFFSSVFRISSPGLQLWTHYDVSSRCL